MELHGGQIIGGERSALSGEVFHGVDPSSGEQLNPAYFEATADEIDQALRLAESVFDEFRKTTPGQRGAFLDAIADETEALGDELLKRASAETGHPLPRCAMERDRAVNQARLFAGFVREGSWVDARIDLGDSGRIPMPKPDVRSLMQPVGPIAIFGASNFPIAISVLGADTISAFACGCPVVIKAHPAHPGTCEIAAQAVIAAALKTGMPAGLFSMVHGKGNAVGEELVRHPATAAAAFTGSLGGGRSLFETASNRPIPIPFYAEMGSVNPIFVLPGALAERGEEIAGEFVGSLTMGVGQFCTNPGLVLGLKSEQWDNFSKSAAEKVGEFVPQTMLHAGIHHAFTSGVEERKKSSDLHLVGESSRAASVEKSEAACYLFETNAEGLAANPELAEELFGPVSTLVKCSEPSDMEAFAKTLSGSLTASVHGTEKDLEEYAGLISVLEKKAGRLIFNGYPVGLEVCHSIHHGGPYPATCHSYFTSIGTRCIQRFVRPVCFQDWPQSALPPELKDENPLEVLRILDGEYTRDAV